jgi:acetoin utilization protein AcuC
MPLLGAYRPDVLVTQMGVDALRSDPLTRLELTTGALELAARTFRSTGIPWIVLGGGGYDKLNVARGWALIWAAVLGVPVPDLLPEGFVQVAAQLGYREKRLRDLPRLAHPDDFARAQQQLERHLAFLERRLFPLHGLLPGGGR